MKNKLNPIPLARFFGRRSFAVDFGTHTATISTFEKRDSSHHHSENGNGKNGNSESIHSENGNGHHPNFEVITDERNVSFVLKGRQGTPTEGKMTVIETGPAAEQMLGRKSEDGEAIRCVTDGEINNDLIAAKQLQKLIEDGCMRVNKRNIGRPTILLAAPETGHATKWVSLAAATKRLNPKKVWLVGQPTAAAAGLGIIGNENPKGRIIIDIGGGTAHIFYADSGGVIFTEAVPAAVPAGGDYFNLSIEKYFRIDEDMKKLRIQVDPITIEELKLKIGSAQMPKNLNDKAENPSMDVTGYSSVKERMFKVTVSRAMLQPFIEETLTVIKDGIIRLLEHLKETRQFTPLRDISENGIWMVGRGSLLHGIASYFSQELDMPVAVTPNPGHVVIRGANKILQDEHLLKKFAKDFTQYVPY